MEQVLRSLGDRCAVVLNWSQQLAVVVEQPDVHTPGCHTQAAGDTVHLSGGTLETDDGLCKELLSVPMLFPTGS